ncbi:MAG: PP2C family serine/threonine-protein phosphatase [Acidimicrobiales bacterium]
MAWRTVGVSVEGAGHRERGDGCQDAHHVELFEDRLVLAVADGAGSAPRGADGAQLAVASAVEIVSAWPAESLGPVALAVAMGTARYQLERLACETGESLGAFATTLHLGVVSEGQIHTAQVGDGAVVARRGEALVVLDPVERGEYLNETVFVTSSAWADEARFGTHAAGDLDAIALLTDGLQLLAFDMAAGTPHRGFFDPLWSWAAEVDQATDGQQELAAFLASPRVQSRTDDDTTLVLAVRN